MSDQELVKEEQAPEAILEQEPESPAEVVADVPAAEAPPATEPEPTVEAVVDEAAEAPPAAEPQPVVEAVTDEVAEASAKTVVGAPPATEPEPAVEAVVDEATEASAETAAEAPPAAEPEPVVEAAVASAEVADVAADPNEVSIFNLQPRQQLSGKVKNITAFGAFVDLGLPQDGLVHISELSRKKVEKVEDVVAVNQEVDVWVKKVDRKRGRISLTMIKPVMRRIKDIEEEDKITGTVTRLETYGAFIDIDSDRDGLVHISQITHDYIKHPQEALEIGQEVNVKVLKVNRKKRQVDLSIKALIEPPVVETRVEEPQPMAAQTSSRPKKDDGYELEEEEPAATAMAVAFASLQGKDDDDDARSDSRGRSNRHRKEQDDIISRTLATKG
jgi:small subunit ribosomal protein S1